MHPFMAKEFFTFITYWIIVPGILLGFFILGKTVTEAALGAYKISAKAGFWAGLILTLISIIYKIPNFKPPELTKLPNIQINLLYLLIGALLGLILPIVLKYLLPGRLIGFGILSLIWASTYLFFEYFFIQTANDLLFSLLLGLAPGILIYTIIWPQFIHDVFVNSQGKSLPE